MFQLKKKVSQVILLFFGLKNKSWEIFMKSLPESLQFSVFSWQFAAWRWEQRLWRWEWRRGRGGWWWWGAARRGRCPVFLWAVSDQSWWCWCWPLTPGWRMRRWRCSRPDPQNTPDQTLNTDTNTDPQTRCDPAHNHLIKFKKYFTSKNKNCKWMG